MSTLKSNNEDMTINADGASSEVKFQANGVEKASISAAGAFTSTTIDATALTGNLPAISGASLTSLPAQSFSGLTGTTVSTSDPATNTNPSATGHLWINKTSGECYVATDITTDDNTWTNIGGGSGNIVGGLRTHNNTWWYTDASQSSSLSSTNIQNLATGTSAISDVLPIDNGSRVSGAGSNVFEYTSNTQAVRTNFSAADPFDIGTNGLSMGCLFKYDGTNNAGLIYYGDDATDNHFFCRIGINTNYRVQIGEDTGASDVWTNAQGSDMVSGSWYFFVATQATDGTLHASTNGANLVQYRSGGSATTPTDALFGLNGDPYNDNASQHDFAVAFWYKGVLTNTQIADEYAYLKTVFTGASLP